MTDIEADALFAIIAAFLRATNRRLTDDERRHLAAHRPAAPQPCTCEGCGRPFLRRVAWSALCNECEPF